MTAPQPRSDGQPRLHVHKIGQEWRVDTGHHTWTLYGTPRYEKAKDWAVAHARR